VFFLAGLTILKKVRCLGRLSGWGVDPVVPLHLRNAEDYSIPTFGPYGTKLGLSWYQWIIKVIFLPGLTILKKVRCLGRLSGWGVDPVVAFRLRNAAEYRLPTCGPHGTTLGYSWYQWIIKSDFPGWFDNSIKGEVSGQIEWMGGLIPCLHSTAFPSFGPHGTKLGHSWYQWIKKSDFSGWFDNSEKGEVSGQIEWMGGWSCGCTPPKECCRLQHTYFWTTWHQTRAFLISVNNKSDFSGWFDNSKKGEVSGQIEWMGGWSCGCTPPKECWRLQHTYFWTTWHQTRAFLISVNNKKRFSWLVWQF